MIDNFIHVNENCMTLEQCQQLIDFFEDNPKFHGRGRVVEEKGVAPDYSKIKKCTEMFISSDDLNKPNVLEHLSRALGVTVDQYKIKYPFLYECARWNISHTFKMQKYLPNEAYFVLHTENTGIVDGFVERRLIAWMLYLNDVTDGGETEFPSLDIKFQPKRGSMLMWPAYWTHPHRGLPSPTQIKYIMTGWFSFQK